MNTFIYSGVEPLIRKKDIIRLCGKSDKALENCLLTIEQAKEFREHYAAEAALLAGDIYLNLGSKNKAMEYYNLALDIKGQDDVYIEIIERIAENHINELSIPDNPVAAFAVITNRE